MELRGTVIFLVLSLALSGCMAEDAIADDATLSTMPSDDVFLMAEDATFSGTFLFSVHGAPMEELPLPLCEPPAECHFYDVPVVAQDAAGNILEDVEADAKMTLGATLTWGSPATDLDVHLLRGGTVVTSSDSGHVGMTPHSERISVDVGPGDYQIMVVGWYVVMDDYDVRVTFDFDSAGSEETA